MSFSSINFIFYFLPLFLALYYLVPRQGKDIVLILGSILFYAWGEPIYVILMLFSVIFHWYMGIDLEEAVSGSQRSKRLIFAIVVNIFILCFFKYYGFLLDNISGITGIQLNHPELSLPLGLSFITFKNISYLVDVYKEKTSAQRNILKYAVYSMMFPHMAQGPIVRYVDIEEKLDIKKRRVTIARLGIGAEFFIKGLAKKVLLADNLGVIFAAINGITGGTSVVTAWIGILAYTFQLYFDFSGYSDMAIGLGKMLGFDFQKNFDYPYVSTSVSEFWRRWHISLGSWFRDYIYIPLGGNRVSTGKQIRNILVVWALTGLWHGASWNFVLWGVYYGLLLLVEKFLLKNFLKSAPVWVTRGYTMLMVIFGWVFFSQTSFRAIGRYFGQMFGIGSTGFIDAATLYYVRTSLVLMILSVLFAGPKMQARFRRIMRKNPMMAVVVDVLLFVLCIAFMVYNSYTPFLYAKF